MKKIYACRPRGAQHIAVQKGCKKAFTLAELLTAVLVISVIMVALAPVITKRMKDNLSVTTDNKKGLEIYANPGTYTFDVPVGINTLFIQGAGGGGGGAGASVSDPKTVTFTSNTTWTIPTGVNQITLEITGSGGGGGGGNATINNAECLSTDYRMLRGANDESDLCWMTKNRDVGPGTTQIGGFWNGGIIIYDPYDSTCTGGTCSWDFDRMVFTYNGAYQVCKSYTSNVTQLNGPYRMPDYIELGKLVKYLDDVATKLNLCCRESCHDYPTGGCALENKPGIPRCEGATKCLGAEANWCAPYAIVGSNGVFLWNGSGVGRRLVKTKYGGASSVRCVKPVSNYTTYSASGGASGAVLEKTINVLPNDTFEITIGQGGAGGASKTKGSQGGTTKIVHKRKNIELGTYYVKGGLGGNPATTSAHGSAYSNNTTSSGTTPSGTCYSRNRKDTSDSFTGGNTSCTTISYSGESGSSTKGGNGGRVKNTGSINNGEASSGGYLYVDSSRTANQRATNEEIRLAKGQNASTPGFGGGGGLTPAWANSTSHFYQGGKGANGKVEITYKVALPGGGGGSSARVAGVDNNNKAYEIIYKVSEGDRIVFKVGSGGSGGIENQDGLNGSATVVGDNDIVFLAGEGGKTATDTDKNNLKGGRGGYTSYINEEDNIQSNIQTGIKLKSKTPPITYTINPPNNSFKGQNGTRGGVPEADTIQSGYTITNTIFSYGFNGGMGASPFNVEKSKTAASISCGGGISGTLGQTTNLKYLCTSGNTKGNDARNHDPVNNEFGGSGGGGGGVKDDSFEQGAGGNGSSGYLRIRWDASEQE